jgi:hypothetical protein
MGVSGPSLLIESTDSMMGLVQTLHLPLRPSYCIKNSWNSYLHALILLHFLQMGLYKPLQLATQ